MKKSSKVLFALTGLAVLCVCAAMAAPLAAGDGTGRGDNVKDSEYPNKAWDSNQTVTKDRGTVTRDGEYPGRTGDDKQTITGDNVKDGEYPNKARDGNQTVTKDRGTATKDGVTSTAVMNPAGSDSQPTQTPAPFLAVIPAVCIGLVLHLKKK